MRFEIRDARRTHILPGYRSRAQQKEETRVSTSNHWRPSRASIAAGLVLVALATVALSEELFVTDARQPAAVLNVGGELLTGTDYRGAASVGEGLVPADELRGGRLVMHPGFVPMWKASQPPPTSGVEPATAPELVNRLVGNRPNPLQSDDHHSLLAGGGRDRVAQDLRRPRPPGADPAGGSGAARRA